MINETDTKDSAGNEAHISCDIAQDYDLDDQCGSPVGEKLAAMLNKMAMTRLSEEKLKEKLNKYSRPQNCENPVGGKGLFPFDQIFRFEIPGILCDEWNSIFRFVGLTNPRSSGSKFRAKIRDQKEGSFTFVYLLWGCWTTLKFK